MNVVNAVCIMLSFGGVAGLAIILGWQQKKLRQRDEEIMSTISAIQYSQLKEHKYGKIFRSPDHRYAYPSDLPLQHGGNVKEPAGQDGRIRVRTDRAAILLRDGA